MCNSFKSHCTIKSLLLVITAALFGFSSIVLPATIHVVELKSYPLFPAVFTAVDNLSIVTYPLLVLSGLILGMIEPNRPIFLGYASVIVFPILATMEKALIVSSHPYYPVEFMFYVLLGSLTVIGGLLGKRFRPYIFRFKVRS